MSASAANQCAVQWGMTQIQLTILLLLIVVLLAAAARRMKIPYPIALVLAGLVLVLVPGMPQVELDPDLILLLFLPPLVQSAALQTSAQDIRANLRPILLLAVGLVLTTMCAVAAVAHLLVPGLSWPAAFVLGAVVSPPDTVAATQIATTLGLPRRLVTVLEGEGLINDGTALTAYHLALAAVAAGGVTVGTMTGYFAYSVVAGVAIGLIVAWLARRLLRVLTEPMMENTVLLVVPFAAYLPADVIGASGVLAVVASGLYYVRYGVDDVSAAGRLQQRPLWQLLEFLLTGLSFLLIGLQLNTIVRELSVDSAGTVALQAGAVCLTVVGLRMGWVLLTAAGARAVQHAGPDQEPSPGMRATVVVGWSGMRGVVTLATALAIPAVIDGEPFQERALLVFIAFAVILVTLLGQGLTLGPLARRLGVVSVADSERQMTLQVRRQTTDRALARLDDLVENSSFPPELIGRFRAVYQTRRDRVDQMERDLDQATDPDPDAIQEVPDRSARTAAHQLHHELINVERIELSRLVSRGVDQKVAAAVRRQLDVIDTTSPL